MKKTGFDIKPLIALTLIVGFCFLYYASMIGFMSYLEAYLGYCSTIKLPYMLDIILWEIIISTCLTCFYIYSKYKKVHLSIIKYSVFVLTLNLLLIIYNTIQYPILIRVSPDWGSGPSDFQIFKNPLIYISFYYALILTLLIYQFRHYINKKLILKVAYISMIILLIFELIIVMNTKYEQCFG